MKWKTLIGLLVSLVLLPLSSACGASDQSTYAWIDVPINGLTLPPGVEVNIEGHASHPGGIARVEIWIEGSLVFTIENPNTNKGLASFAYTWLPPSPGQYTIQVQAFGADGTASSADTTIIYIGGTSDRPVPVISPTPAPTDVTLTPTNTFTPTSTPAGAVVQLWAEPPEINAGACTTIRWHVENANRVVFGGADQPFDGSYKDCLCGNQRYSLTVIHLDGTEEKRTLDILVNGSCETPTSPPPPADTTAPPAPMPVVPDNGLTLSCRASQSLAWLPVNDPSGISQYQVEVQRHAGDNNWQSVGSMSISDKTTSSSVECGWYYRWRVRAVDGSGNVGGWSGWWQFSITLT